MEEQMKKLKEENKRLKKELEKFKKYQEQIGNYVYIINETTYEKYDNLQKSINDDSSMNLDDIDLYVYFKKLIEKIDINNDIIEGNQNYKITEIINHKIDTKLEKSVFITAFSKAIDQNINKNWKKEDRINLKKLIDNLYTKEIKELFYDIVPEHIRQLRMDLILSFVLADGYNEKFKNNQILIQSENFSKNPLNKGIHFIDPEKNKKVLFDKKFIFKQIKNNVGILNGYYKTIQMFVGKKYTLNDLINKISYIVNNTNIYFIDSPKDILGMTICSGDIFINGKFMEEAIYETNDQLYNYVGIAKIYLTLLHEIAHKLQYIIRAESNSNNKEYCNFFVKTFRVKKDKNFGYITSIQKNVNENYDYKIENFKRLEMDEFNKIILFDNLHPSIEKIESGDFFDNEIYLGQTKNYVTKNICKFFLSHTCDKYEDFINIVSYLIKNMNKDEKTRNNTYRIFPEHKPVCLSSFLRNQL